MEPRADLTHAIGTGGQGIRINANCCLGSGDYPPIIDGGVRAPVGSIWLESDGRIWRKVGPDDVDWLLIVNINSGSSYSKIFQEMATLGHVAWYEQYIYAGGFLTGVRVYTADPVTPSAVKILESVRELHVEENILLTETINIYDASGTVIVTQKTGSYTYTQQILTSVQWQVVDFPT